MWALHMHAGDTEKPGEYVPSSTYQPSASPQQESEKGGGGVHLLLSNLKTILFLTSLPHQEVGGGEGHKEI